MFDSKYLHVCVGFKHAAKKEYLLGIRFYTFKTEKHKYIVEVETYINNIYVLQYYLKKHKNNPRKYMLLTHEYKCNKIVGTCISIMLDIFRKDSDANFGFIGSNTYNPISNKEEPIHATKRFNVYKYAMEAKMGTETFTHAWLPEYSRYVMINKKNNPVEFLDYINEVFYSMYDKESFRES